VEKLIQRAIELKETGNFRLACHLADWAYLAGQNNPEVGKEVHQIYAARAEAETSTMAMGIIMAMAREVLGEKSEEAAAGPRVLQAQEERGRKHGP